MVLCVTAFADITSEPRKGIAVSDGATLNQSFPHGPLSTIFYGNVTKEDAHGSNELVAEIFLSGKVCFNFLFYIEKIEYCPLYFFYLH